MQATHHARLPRQGSVQATPAAKSCNLFGARNALGTGNQTIRDCSSEWLV